MYSIFEINEIVNGVIKYEGSDIKFIDKVSTLNDSDQNSLVWIKKAAFDKQNIINSTTAAIFIVPKDENLVSTQGKALIEVNNPRLAFIRIIEQFFTKKIVPKIHPTASIDSSAKIDETASIGPFTYVGNSKIGKNSIIFGNVYIYDNVQIGDNVIVHSGSVIGADGFGYERDDDGSVYKFPHIGGVVIEDNVEIGSNTCIDKGALGNTLIKKGAKIDNLVHIAHNVIIGEETFVIANSMIGGSTIVGDNTWIAPSVSLMNGISIGSSTIIGMASLVTKNVPDFETWTGSPARNLNDFLKIQNKLKGL